MQNNHRFRCWHNVYIYDYRLPRKGYWWIKIWGVGFCKIITKYTWVFFCCDLLLSCCHHNSAYHQSDMIFSVVIVSVSGLRSRGDLKLLMHTFFFLPLICCIHSSLEQNVCQIGWLLFTETVQEKKNKNTRLPDILYSINCPPSKLFTSLFCLICICVCPITADVLVRQDEIN